MVARRFPKAKVAGSIPVDGIFLNCFGTSLALWTGTRRAFADSVERIQRLCEGTTANGCCVLFVQSVTLYCH